MMRGIFLSRLIRSCNQQLIQANCVAVGMFLAYFTVLKFKISCVQSTSLNPPDSVAGASVGRPACTVSCSLAGSVPQMSPPWSADTGNDRDEHQLLSDTP